MNHDDYLIAARALKKITGKEHAILAGKDPAHVGVHTLPIPQGDETAIAALLHRVTKDQPGNSLYVSYEPTEMCLGLAWRPGVDAVYALTEDARSYKRYSVKDEDCLPTGWKTAAINLKTETKWNDGAWCEEKADLVRGIERLSGRPKDETIEKKLGHGLAKRVPVSAWPDVHEDFMRVVYALVRLGWNDKVDESRRKTATDHRPFGNNIGGILVGATNKILGWGLNFKHVNPTFHAETMMIQYFLRRHNLTTLPKGCRVYTSLECCHMCAGYIASVGADIEVFYGQKDPNIQGANALERKTNGCSQRPSRLPPVTVLAQRMDPKSRDVISFLFKRGQVAPVLAEVIADTRRWAYARYLNGDKPNPVLKEGNLFLQDLQDMGILHEMRGAPLTVVL